MEPYDLLSVEPVWVLVCPLCRHDLWPASEGLDVEHDCATGEVVPA